MAVRFALVFLIGVAAGVGAAPVPKAPAPVPFTADQVVGTWDYSWGTAEHGVIEFRADGTYGAQHYPGSDTAYAGGWAFKGATVTLHEVPYSVSTGQSFSTSSVAYAFDFGATRPPVLRGTSTSAALVTPVALSNRTR